MDNSKLEDKSFLSDKLFSENSDDGLKDKISTTKISEKKEFDFKNRTNNSSFMKPDFSYLPIEKSVEAKKLKYLTNKFNNLLDSNKYQPVEYKVTENTVTSKSEINNSVKDMNKNNSNIYCNYSNKITNINYDFYNEYKYKKV